METATCREGDDLGGELGEGEGALCTVYVGLGFWAGMDVLGWIGCLLA